MNTVPPFRRRARRHASFILSAATAACLASSARAQSQIVFGIDYRGATIATPDSQSTTPITEADILKAPFGLPTFGPMPPPQIAFTGAQLGLTAYSACVGHAAGTACRIEVDAISFGTDAHFNNTLPIGAPGRARLYFSVDRFATGLTGTGIAPNVRSEGALGAGEAAADIFTPVTTITGPIAPGPLGPNFGVFDGNGLPSASGHRYRGFGLREPSSPGPFDDIDAFSIGPIPSGPTAFVYFSLDGAIVDPLTSLTGSDSAGLQGVSPSAVLRRSLSGGPLTIYANPNQLGLNPLTDDLDALILSENGNGTYQPSVVFYDWLSGTTDMLLFSVRRGSAIIGQTDSLFGIPIEAGDVLAPPATPGQRPRIFIAAEALGLATERSSGAIEGDELDALGSESEPYLDCNTNGRDDAEDIALGFSSDTNNNNIPDECEQSYVRYCYCPSPLGPCGNHDAAAGCKNVTGQGGLLCGFNTTSTTTDDLVIGGEGLPPFSPALLFMGPGQVQTAFGNGLQCVGPTTYRMLIRFADGAGAVSYGPGIVGLSNGLGGAAIIESGYTWNFQAWYRDSSSFCTFSGFNLTNGLSILFTP